MICFYHKASGGGAPGSTPNAIVEDHFTHASAGNLAGNLPDTVGSSAWAAESGTISYIGGGVVQTANATYKIQSGFAPTALHPITIEVSVRGGTGSYGGIALRQADGGTYMLFFIYPGGSGWEIDQTTAGDYNTLTTGSAAYPTATWHALKVVDDGTNINFYVNGSLVTTRSSTVNNTNTKVGIEGGFPIAEFKDFVVTRAP